MPFAAISKVTGEDPEEIMSYLNGQLKVKSIQKKYINVL